MVNCKGLLVIAIGCTALALAGCGGGDGNGQGTPSCGDNGSVDPNGSTTGGKTPGMASNGDAGSTSAPPDSDGGASGNGGSGGSSGSGGSGSDGGSTGTGGGSGSDGGSSGSGGSGGDAGAPAATLPAPLQSPSMCFMTFSKHYINDAVCGEVRGTLPGMSWSGGPSIMDTDADGYLELHLASIPAAGTYELSYLERECPGQPHKENWASFADSATLKAMSSDARTFIYCNWWDPVALKTVSVPSPSCGLRVQVDYACTVTGAGNMKDFK